MSQLNIHVTPEFARALQKLMRLRGISSKSEAIRLAVVEAAERQQAGAARTNFTKLLGIGKRAPENPNPRFRSDDELWEK